MAPILATRGAGSALGFGRYSVSTEGVGLFESIASVYMTSSTSTAVTFSNIPQTYRHLQIRTFHATRQSSTNGYGTISMNGSPSGVRNLLFTGGSNTVTSYKDASTGAITESLNDVYHGSSVIDLLDYTNTNKRRTFRVFSGVDLNGNGSLGFNSLILDSQSAVTSVTVTPNETFQPYSRVSLYGIKDS